MININIYINGTNTYTKYYSNYCLLIHISVTCDTFQDDLSLLNVNAL